MVKEIILCVEGGGDANSKARFREGIGRLLDDLRLEAVKHGVQLRIVPGGSRSNTFDEFTRMHVARRDGVLVLLLVDSEGPVDCSPREHLDHSDNWKLSGVADEQVHLMVQTMEAWLVADPDALERFYGKGFTRGILPKTQIVENIPKDDLEPALKRATRDTAKGEYHKTRHAFAILAQLDVNTVRQRAPHFDRLVRTIRAYLVP